MAGKRSWPKMADESVDPAGHTKFEKDFVPVLTCITQPYKL